MIPIKDNILHQFFQFTPMDWIKGSPPKEIKCHTQDTQLVLNLMYCQIVIKWD